MSRPKQSPSTLQMTFRGDIRNLATLVQWFKVNNTLPRSRSDILTLSIQCLVEFIKKQNPECLIKDIESAVHILSQHRLLGEPELRIRQAIAHAQQSLTAQEMDMPLWNTPGDLSQDNNNSQNGGNSNTHIQNKETANSLGNLSNEVARLLEQRRIKEQGLSEALRRNILPTMQGVEIIDKKGDSPTT